MDITNNQVSPVIMDPAPVNNSRFGGVLSSLLPYPKQGTSSSSSKYITIPRRKPGKLDDVRSNGWLDAMKASSPTCKKLAADNSDIALEDIDSAHLSWMLKYPSALRSFEHIVNFANGKRIAIFLDYDGTLSPIVDDPDSAFMSTEMRSAVKNVAKYFPTAIISGRSRDKVYDLVGLNELYYAGSHGMDIMGPIHKSGSEDCLNYVKSTDQRKMVNLFQPAREFLPAIDKVFRALVESTKGIRGANVENHKFCTSVHYRNVEEKDWPIVAHRVRDVLKDYPGLQLTHGRKVLEVRPLIEWNKGEAVEFLLESLGLSSRNDVLAIHIGDDNSDEDAFRVLRTGNIGFGILVSSFPKETRAVYSLKDPAEVMEFLKSLVSWKEMQRHRATYQSPPYPVNSS
ncbi:hypothetical protein SAY86_029455 [Trapa natans]|uniref:Trehalose 6-phosphate phosphatase n=1 Tax=Trapa natans TaxID=22666 RepID=A0AAN7M3P8_TRANT|nr:hypothetical protein SAY86_029455 [Trapa natans]